MDNYNGRENVFKKEGLPKSPSPPVVLPQIQSENKICEDCEQ